MALTYEKGGTTTYGGQSYKLKNWNQASRAANVRVEGGQLVGDVGGKTLTLGTPRGTERAGIKTTVVAGASPIKEVGSGIVTQEKLTYPEDVDKARYAATADLRESAAKGGRQVTVSPGMDELSAAYGATSYLPGETLPGEISGQEKLTKYQKAGLHPAAEISKTGVSPLTVSELASADFAAEEVGELPDRPERREGQSDTDYILSLAAWNNKRLSQLYVSKHHVDSGNQYILLEVFQ